jgi:adenylylsulfate kinase
MIPRQENEGIIVWFTGLSGAGKTTIAHRVWEELIARGIRTEVLDGDVMRQHICRGLGFSREDRDENVRRLGFVGNLLARNGIVALVSAVSPYRDTREEIRRSASGVFLEVFVSAPLHVCEQRDPKGLYRRARAGELHQFTGIDDPYEPPTAPEIVCSTDQETIEASVNSVLRVLLPVCFRDLAAAKTT